MTAAETIQRLLLVRKHHEEIIADLERRIEAKDSIIEALYRVIEAHNREKSILEDGKGKHIERNHIL